MIAYSLLFMATAIPALQERYSRNMPLSARTQPYWLLMRFLLIVLIGFRYEVGGDWFTYLRYLERARSISFVDILTHADPGYVFFNVLSDQLGFGVTGVNVLSAIIVVYGLFVFLQSLPRPWLGLACAIPYLVIVVAMGYTRQSVALGFVMLGMAAIQRTHFKRFMLWVLLGAAFHKTAILILPLAALVSTRRRIQKIGMVGVASAVGFDLFLANHGQRLYDVYIDMQVVESDGALIRLMMNAIPGVLYLSLLGRLDIPRAEKSFWRYVSLASLLMLVALFATNFSTALDRMALYFIPLQLVVFSYLPDALKGKRQTWVSLILLYYALILLVWLNFASHSRYWLPYQMGFS